MSDSLALVVTDLRCEAKDVLWLELRSAEGRPLPAFTAGSHLELRLAGGLIRHYSLCNDPAESHRYCIAVGLAAESRGGSRHMHTGVRVGSLLTSSAPRNNFPLDLSADDFVFVAGGIGITPILSMIKACEAAGKRWQLHYAARNRQRMAFYEELTVMARDRTRLHFDDEADGCFFDPVAALANIPPEAHVYCCGPSPVMTGVQRATVDRPEGSVHFEWFSAAPAVPATSNRPFTILLSNSGKRFDVPADRSILEVLEDNGEGVPFSCREGLCATCKTGVVSGIPEHRDQVLSAEERATNAQMLICVSRSCTDVLELDL